MTQYDDSDTGDEASIDTAFVDTDADGFADAILLDTDADQIADTVLVDTDADGSIDAVFWSEPSEPSGQEPDLTAEDNRTAEDDYADGGGPLTRVPENVTEEDLRMAADDLEVQRSMMGTI